MSGNKYVRRTVFQLRKPRSLIKIKLVVSGQEKVSVIHFKINPKRSLHRLMKFFCAHVGRKVEECRFLHELMRVHGHHIPEEIGIKDNDRIDVHYDFTREL